jgi:hypothetical protein
MAKAHFAFGPRVTVIRRLYREIDTVLKKLIDKTMCEAL